MKNLNEKTLRNLKKALEKRNGTLVSSLFPNEDLKDEYNAKLDNLTNEEKELFKKELKLVENKRVIEVNDDDLNITVKCIAEFKKRQPWENESLVLKRDRKKSYRKQDKKEKYNKILETIDILVKQYEKEYKEYKDNVYKTLCKINDIRNILRVVRGVNDKNISEKELNRILEDYIEFYINENKEALSTYKGYENINVYNRRPDGFGHEIVTHPVIDYFNKNITTKSWGSDD